MGENRRGHISPPEGLARGELKRRTSLEELWAGGRRSSRPNDLCERPGT